MVHPLRHRARTPVQEKEASGRHWIQAGVRVSLSLSVAQSKSTSETTRQQPFQLLT